MGGAFWESGKLDSIFSRRPCIHLLFLVSEVGLKPHVNVLYCVLYTGLNVCFSPKKCLSFSNHTRAHACVRSHRNSFVPNKKTEAVINEVLINHDAQDATSITLPCNRCSGPWHGGIFLGALEETSFREDLQYCCRRNRNDCGFAKSCNAEISEETPRVVTRMGGLLVSYYSESSLDFALFFVLIMFCQPGTIPRWSSWISYHGSFWVE